MDDADPLLAALADPARWRLVRLLAERPRPVGVLAQLAEARQPQTTKHLQTLERAGVVTSQRSGQRRVYALRPGPLRDLAAALGRLADTAEEAEGSRETYERYGLSLASERLAAEEPGWADDRSFRFHRSLTGGPEAVWRHLTETALLTHWWTPDDLRVSELVFEARPGGRILLEYRDAEDTEGTDPAMRPGKVSSTPHTPASDSPTGSPPPARRQPRLHGPRRLRPPARRHRDRLRHGPRRPLPDHRQHGRLRRLHRGHRDRLRPEPRQARHRRRRSSRHDSPSSPHRRKAGTAMTSPTGRKVTANIALTLDGRYNGPGGPGDISAILPYATTEVARNHLTRIWENATTALLGRVNAEGFLGYWPTVAADENADPRDRGYAKWLVDTEKVVLSTTLAEAPWERARGERPGRRCRRRAQGRMARATSWSTPARASPRHSSPRI